MKHDETFRRLVDEGVESVDITFRIFNRRMGESAFTYEWEGFGGDVSGYGRGGSLEDVLRGIARDLSFRTVDGIAGPDEAIYRRLVGDPAPPPPGARYVQPTLPFPDGGRSVNHVPTDD